MMSKIKYFIGGIILLFSVNVSGQTPIPWIDADNVIPFCTEENPLGITYPAATTNENVPGFSIIGCLGSTPSPAWFIFRIDNPGDMVIEMTHSNQRDIDFILWGPFEGTSKQQVLNNVYAGLPGTFVPYPTGDRCNYSTDWRETATIRNAHQGEWYIFLITNYSKAAGNINFNKISGTATTTCSIIIDLSSNGPICAGENLELWVNNAPAGATFQWTGPNGFTSTSIAPVIPNATTANSGIYSVVMTANGQSSSPVSLEVKVNPTYTIHKTVEIQAGETYTFGNQVLTTTGDYQHLFQSVAGCDSLVYLRLEVGCTVPQTTDAITICQSELPYTYGNEIFNTAGVKDVTFLTANGCDSIVTVTLTVNPIFNQTETLEICSDRLPYTWRNITLPAGTVSGAYVYNRQTYLGCDSIVTLHLTVYQINYIAKDATICKGESYDLRSSILNLQNTQVRFYSSPNDISTEISPIVSPTTTTTYYVSADNPMGCILDGTIQITVTDKPTVGSIPNLPTICEGEILTLTPPAVTDGDAPIIRQTWLLDGQAFDPTTSISYEANNKTLKYIVENSCGTVSSNEIVLSVYEHPDLYFPDENICFGNSVELHAPKSDAYLWLPIMSTQQNPIVTPTETTVYTLRLTNGPCSFEYPVFVNVMPLPNEVTVTQRGLGLVRIYDGDNYTYLLNNGAPTSSTELNSLASGFHFLEVRNSYGCSIRQTFFVRGLTIPPYFSPNDDGVNDNWVIENLNAFPDAKIHIYDRIGKLLDTLNANRPVWNGKFNGNHMPSTDYWYLLELPEFRETQTGHFTLIR